MQKDYITITIDAETAEKYRAASDEVRQKIDSVLNLKLRAILNSSTKSLSEGMDRISNKATERGMTPEILESLLKDK